jgi:hypothetical protein
MPLYFLVQRKGMKLRFISSNSKHPFSSRTQIKDDAYLPSPTATRPVRRIYGSTVTLGIQNPEGSFCKAAILPGEGRRALAFLEAGDL